MRRYSKFIKYLYDYEFKSIEQYIRKLKNPAMRACLMVMLYLGLRVNEAVKLRRTNFNKNFSELTFHVSKQGKVIPRKIPEFLRRELARFWHDWYCRSRDKHLFWPSYHNQSNNVHLQTSSVRNQFIKMRKELKLEQVYYTTKNGIKLHRVTPHTLRHYAIYRYYKAAGNDLIAAQHIIGHEDAKTTAKYIYPIEKMNRELEIIERAWAET